MRSTVAALRQGAWGIGGFVVAGFALTLLQSIAYYRLTGHGTGGPAVVAYHLSTLAPSVLYPAPVRPDTIAGYLQLLAFGPLAILFAAWALVSAVGFVISGSAEFRAEVAAFGISVVIAAAAATTGAAIGVASGDQVVSAAELAGDGLMLVVFALACYGICLTVAQLTSEPALVTGGVMLVLFFLNSLSRIFTQLDYARWLSPFRYVDVGSYGALIAIAIGGLVLAALPFVRRTTRERPRSKTFEDSQARLLGIPVARDVYLQRRSFVAWSAAALLLGVILAAAAHDSLRALLSLPKLLPGIQGLIAATYAELLARMWFDVMLLLFAGLAMIFAARWSAADSDGRLATVLSAPYSRATLVLERVASVAAVSAVLATLAGLALLITSQAGGINMDAARLFDACVILVVFAAVAGGVGSLFAAWVPRGATTLVGVFVLAGYLDHQIGGALGLPGWLQSLSPFNVGDPLRAGIDASKLALLAALVAAAVGSSILLMQVRDVNASPRPRDLPKVANPAHRR